MDTSCYNSFSTIKKTIWSNNQFVFVLYVQWNRKWVVYNGKICELYREESEMYAMERSVIYIKRKVKCMQWKDLWFVSRGNRDVCNGKICGLIVSRGKWVVYNGKVCDLYQEESEMYAMERYVICIQSKDLWCVSRGKWNVCNQKICDLYRELFAMEICDFYQEKS